jgi:cytochrome c oxidase subunit II
MLAHGTLLAQSASADPESLYFPCISCHGKNGEGSPAIRAPAIGGQSSVYLERQLHNFRMGIRGQHPGDPWGAQMALMAENLNDDDINVLADFVSQMPVKKTEGGTSEAPEFYVGCVACHGKKGQGIESLNAPRIAGLDEAYTSLHLRYFRDGLRGSVEGDQWGAVMRDALPDNINDAAIQKLAKYIQSL